MWKLIALIILTSSGGGVNQSVTVAEFKAEHACREAATALRDISAAAAKPGALPGLRFFVGVRCVRDEAQPVPGAHERI